MRMIKLLLSVALCGTLVACPSCCKKDNKLTSKEKAEGWTAES